MSTRLQMAEDGREAAARALLGRDKTADQMGLEDYESGLVDALSDLAADRLDTATAVKTPVRRAIPGGGC